MVTRLAIGLMAVLAVIAVAQTQGPPANFQNLLRTGDVAGLAAVLDKDPALASRRDAQGVQPLFWAAVYGQQPIVELLLARGADPRASSPLGTALSGAAAGGRTGIIRLLVARGADPNTGGETGVIPLIRAARRGQLPVVEALLEAGASTAAVDSTGNTALLMAASYGVEPVVRLFASKHAAVINAANESGATPLDVARREGHAGVAAFLETQGAVPGRPVAALSGPWLGQTPPGLTPAVMAPAFVSTERRELNPAFTPDGRTMFFSRDRNPRGTAIMMTSVDGARWTLPSVAPFSRDGHSDIDVFVTTDGREIYFCSERPVPGSPAPTPDPAKPMAAPRVNIWTVSRTAAGWSEPSWLGPSVSSEAADYYPTLTRTGTLYFSSNRRGGLGENDIYRARRVDGRWSAPENLGPPISTPFREYDPFIAPDESYVIFASERPGGLGGADLYISFRRDGGAWSEPLNMGAPLNSPAGDYTPLLSTDGTFLFFTSNRQGQDDIYWVDARVVEPFRAASQQKR